LFLTGTLAIIVGIVSSCVALFAIGAGTSLFTGHGVEFSGLRQIGIGLGAAAITFGIGRLIGVSLGG
jgi:VIT1/CCC1 family predicted Fe2+/Mn2+ transporter